MPEDVVANVMEPDEREDARADCAAIFRHVAPIELARVPLYVVFSSELPTSHQGAGFGGCASVTMDLAFRAEIGHRWEGRGVCVLLNDLSYRAALRRIADQWPGENAAQLPDLDVCVRSLHRRYLLSVAIHELAHHARWGFRVHDAADVAAERELVARLADITAQPPEGTHAPPSFEGHEWQFVRCLLHAEHRVASGGRWRLDRDVLFNASLYRLSPLAVYAEALGDEPKRMESLSFATINAEPPPAAFRDVWNANVLAWIDGRPDPVAEIGRYAGGSLLIDRVAAAPV